MLMQTHQIDGPFLSFVSHNTPNKIWHAMRVLFPKCVIGHPFFVCWFVPLPFDVPVSVTLSTTLKTLKQAN